MNIKHIFLNAILLCSSTGVFSANLQESAFNGFYVGGHTGYWRSQDNDIRSTGSVSFVNPTYELGASNIANALAQMTTNNITIHSNGIIGGVQAGYNYRFSNRYIVGFNADLDGISQSKNQTTLYKTVNLANYDEQYAGSFTIKQKINYLGTLRARLGYLYHSDFLIFVSGGFAYSDITSNTDWRAQESLGPSVFPIISSQNKFDTMFNGWCAGAGVEWLFQSHWSAILEYLYYSFNTEKMSTTLSQMNESVTPPAVWGSAVVNTTSSINLWNIRLGLSYHFL